MTLDEAIAHSREVAEEQRVKNRTCGNCKYCVKGQIHPRQGYCYFNSIHYEQDLNKKACSNWESNDDICCACAEEHKQLAEWLEELKEYRKIGTPQEIINERIKLLTGIGNTYYASRADAIDEFANWLVEQGVLGNRCISDGEITDYGKVYAKKYKEQLKLKEKE